MLEPFDLCYGIKCLLLKLNIFIDRIMEGWLHKSFFICASLFHLHMIHRRRKELNILVWALTQPQCVAMYGMLCVMVVHFLNESDVFYFMSILVCVCSLQAQCTQTVCEKRSQQLWHQHKRHGQGLTRTWHFRRQI